MGQCRQSQVDCRSRPRSPLQRRPQGCLAATAARGTGQLEAEAGDGHTRPGVSVKQSISARPRLTARKPRAKLARDCHGFVGSPRKSRQAENACSCPTRRGSSAFTRCAPPTVTNSPPLATTSPRSSSSSNGSNRALKPHGKINSCSCPSGFASHVRTAPSTIAPTRVPALCARRWMVRPQGSGFRGDNSKIRRASHSSGGTTGAYGS